MYHVLPSSWPSISTTVTGGRAPPARSVSAATFSGRSGEPSGYHPSPRLTTSSNVAGVPAAPIRTGGWGFWTGLGYDPAVGEADELAVDADDVLGPQPTQDGQLLPEDGPPALRVDAVVDHLQRVPAETDAHLDPTAGDDVEAGHRLGQLQRVALGDEQDAGSDPYPLGHRGGHRQLDEGVEEALVELRQPVGVLRVDRRHRRVGVLAEEEGVEAVTPRRAGRPPASAASCRSG